MGAADILTARTASRGRSAAVACGELGLVTVEALPLRELELLYRGADGTRKVAYAACRELQQVGETLHQAGRIYTPDGVLQYLSDDEASLLAREVFRLSGRQMPGGEDEKNTGADSPEIRSVPAQMEDEGCSAVVLQESPRKHAEAQVPEFFTQAEPVLSGTGNVDETAQTFAAFPQQDAAANAVLEDIPPSGKSAFADADTAEYPGKTGWNFRSTTGQAEPERDSRLPDLLNRPMPENIPFRLSEHPQNPTEAVAKALLAGLQQAKWMRGG